MKTGYTSNARNCLIASASRNGVDLISVVLGGTTTENGKSAIYTDSRNLLDYGFSCYEKTTIAKEGDTITQITPKRSKNKVAIVAVLKDNIRMIHKTKETPEFTSVTTLNENLTAPINKGDTVGTISYYHGDELIATSELIADNSVEKEPWYSIVFKFIVKTIITIIIIFISLILLLIIFNKIRRLKNKNRERIFY
jgi:D-alanyl-D-alanine carboxypeptidase (penicillin-binding protein 5/6)